jgi:hypothetical protein
MDDRIRVSDADRDRVAAQLRDHFAEGRLTQDELDERVSATLNAKTFGDLRPIMADLPGPGPAPVLPPAGQRPQWATPPWAVRRYRPSILPLILLALVIAALAPAGGGLLLFVFFRMILVFWLVACVAGVLGAARFRRRARRDWHSEYSRPEGKGPHWF